MMATKRKGSNLHVEVVKASFMPNGKHLNNFTIQIKAHPFPTPKKEALNK